MAVKEVEWGLAIEVLHLRARKVLRVCSDWSVGHVLATLSTKLLGTNISYYGLWWPDKRLWLRKQQQTLHGYGIMSDVHLQLVDLNHTIYVELPDKSVYKCVVNFSNPVFEVVTELCKRLSIRRPEELSLLKFKDTVGTSKKKKKKTNAPNSEDGIYHPDINMDHSPEGVQFHRMNDNEAIFSEDYIKNLKDRAYINRHWLYSNLSLYEQGVIDDNHLYLRFKYHSFFDLNPNLDDSRIKQLFEQAKWSVLTEEVDCTEEEAITFAALQFQVTLSLSQQEQSQKDYSIQLPEGIDEELYKLQAQLGQIETTNGAEPSKDQYGYLRVLKGSGFTLRSSKRHWFMLQGVTLCEYKTHEDNQCIEKYNIKGATSEADLDPTKNKFAINLQPESGSDLRLYCDNSDDYVNWMSSIKIATRGEILTEIKLDREKASVNAFIAMQAKPAQSPQDGASHSATNTELQPSLLVSQRFFKKYKGKTKDISRKIIEAHASCLNLSLIDSQMQYIRNWMALYDYGISYFIVQFSKHKKEALLGLSFNRLVAVDIYTFEQVKVWRYAGMKSWKINWQTKEMKIVHEEGDFGFTCLSADLRIVHEFIGGNVFLYLREDPHAPLDLELFQKLTMDMTAAHSGWGEESITHSLRN